MWEEALLRDLSEVFVNTRHYWFCCLATGLVICIILWLDCEKTHDGHLMADFGVSSAKANVAGLTMACASKLSKGLPWPMSGGETIVRCLVNSLAKSHTESGDLAARGRSTASVKENTMDDHTRASQRLRVAP